MADNYSSDSRAVDEKPGAENSDAADNSDEALLEEAKARFKLAEDAESEIRKEALDDLEFAAGHQWHDQDISNREADGRPCLVINRIPQFIQQVTNDQRQNRPAIKVHAVDSEEDVETAKIYQGMIRHIEQNSNADAAYDTAFDSAVRSRFGFFRIITKYVSPHSFEQEILIKRVRDRFTAYLDPHHQEPDGSDANWGFAFEDISKDEFKNRYPKAELAAQGEWELQHNASPEWVKADTVRIAEYFYKENQDETLVELLMPNGAVAALLAKDFESKLGVNIAAASLAEGSIITLPTGDKLQVARTRKTSVPSIKWCKLNGCEVLEKTDWPGIYIPIIPVYGGEQIINGKRVLESLVTHAKDPQRMLNYWKSAETEAIALAPRAPFIAAKGQIEGFENDWKNANRRNISVLEYNPVDLKGTPLPAPQRNFGEPAVMAITNAAAGASEDLKSVVGIYDATLGGRSNETSGKAILARNNQAQTSNFHFIDNLTRSLRHAGRILVDLIPKIYDTPRAARIIGEDGEQEIIKINQAFQHKGEERAYQLSRGKYDVTVDVGPSYASKRQEAANSMIELSRSIPQLGQNAPDLLIKTFDFVGVQEIAERLKKTLPPGLADDPKGKQPLPPEVQAQMQQSMQMIDQLTGQLTELQTERETKLLELESKERIEMAKLETQAAMKLAELESKEAQITLQNELNDARSQLQRQIDELNHRQDMLGMQEPISYGDEQNSQDFAPAEPAGADMSAMGGQAEAFDPAGDFSLAEPVEQSDDDPSAY